MRTRTVVVIVVLMALLPMGMIHYNLASQLRRPMSRVDTVVDHIHLKDGATLQLSSHHHHHGENIGDGRRTPQHQTSHKLGDTDQAEVHISAGPLHRNGKSVGPGDPNTLGGGEAARRNAAFVIPQPQSMELRPNCTNKLWGKLGAAAERRREFIIPLDAADPNTAEYLNHFLLHTGAAEAVSADWATFHPGMPRLTFARCSGLSPSTSSGCLVKLRSFPTEVSSSGASATTSEMYAVDVEEDDAVVITLPTYTAVDPNPEEGGNDASGNKDKHHHQQQPRTAATPLAPLLYALHSLVQLSFTYSSPVCATDSSGSNAHTTAVPTTNTGPKASSCTPSLAHLPCAVVTDFPKYRWRGLHIDTARHYFSTRVLTKMVRRMARLKLNVLHWHLSDDQGWRMESKVFPTLHTVGGRRGPSLNGKKRTKHNGTAYPTPKFHTQAEIKSLIEFARVRNVHIVPEIDLPAHAAAIIAAFEASGNPHLTKFGYTAKEGEGNDDCGPRVISNSLKTGAPNCMGGTFGVVYPSSHAFEILSSIIGEMCEVFRNTPFLHVGGDQAEYLRGRAWRKDNPDSADFWKEVNFKDLGATQALFTTKLIKEMINVKCGKTAVVWDETYLELGKTYYPPGNTHVMVWRYDDLHIFEEKEKRLQSLRTSDDLLDEEEAKKGAAGGVGGEKRKFRLPVIVTPKQRLYFDYVQHYPWKDNRYAAQQRPASYFKFQAVTFRRSFWMHREVPPPSSDSAQKSLLDVAGFQGCVWSELLTSEEMLWYQLVPRIYALADAAWTVRVESAAEEKAKWDWAKRRYGVTPSTVAADWERGERGPDSASSTSSSFSSLKHQHRVVRNNVDWLMLVDPV